MSKKKDPDFFKNINLKIELYKTYFQGDSLSKQKVK